MPLFGELSGLRNRMKPSFLMRVNLQGSRWKAVGGASKAGFCHQLWT